MMKLKGGDNMDKNLKKTCHHDCFHCIYPDCIDESGKMTDFEKKCAEIANAPEIHAEHTIREYRFHAAGRKIDSGANKWRR